MRFAIAIAIKIKSLSAPTGRVCGRYIVTGCRCMDCFGGEGGRRAELQQKERVVLRERWREVETVAAASAPTG